MATPHTPFETIESAQEFVHLLIETIDEAIVDVDTEIERADAGRHLDALRLAAYKLDQLRGHTTAAGRILNDLRTLRRLLLNSAVPTSAAAPPR